MLFFSLKRVAAALLLQQVPLLGPLVQALLSTRDHDRLVSKLDEILGEVSRLRDDVAITEYLRATNPGLAPVLVAFEAGRAGRLLDSAPAAPAGRPRRRFLYLAAGEYASSVRTSEIAAEDGFLWRPYHRNVGSSNANVKKISVGDLVILGYRAEPGQFQVLMPLIVVASGPQTHSIDPGSFTCHAHYPFAISDEFLGATLAAEGYDPDLTFKRHCGLNVMPLLPRIHTPGPTSIYGELFTSPPGQNALWSLDYASIPSRVRDWGDDLLRAPEADT